MAFTLQHHALQVCYRFPESTFVDKDGEDGLSLREGIYLPESICDLLFSAIAERRPLNYLQVFTNKAKCQLTKIDLSNQKLKDLQDTIMALFEHNLEEVILSNAYFDKESADKLGDYGKNLDSLILSGTKGGWTLGGAPFLRKLENLRKLDVSGIAAPFRKCIVSISTLKNLVWLDMSSTELQTILPLKNLSSTLQHLYLYDACQNIDDYDEELLEIIPQLTSLTHLDISKHCELKPTHYKMAPHLDGELLQKIAYLPNLLYLDISGCDGLKTKDLESFSTGLSRKLQFFGLFATNLEWNSNLPAEQITGLANEEQMLNALELYGKRDTYLAKALPLLFEIANERVLATPLRAVKVIVSSSRFHMKNERIQLAAVGSIYRIVQQDVDGVLDAEVRRSAISMLVDLMECNQHIEIMRICLHCLCTFNIQEELEFVSLKLSQQLLEILKSYMDQQLQLIAIVILNAVLMQTSIKWTLGQYGAVKILLDVIRYHREHVPGDRFLETCWCALWNVTDETPENCEDFVNNGGLTLFKEFVREFEGENDMQKSVLGLMGNIAEVKSLHSKILEDDTIRLLIQLLDSETYDFEVSYNAAGILSHVCSDGDEAWTLPTLSRSDCMKFVTASVSKWDINSSRNINYRSLKPLLRLLPLDFNPCGQEWAAWALANLTNVLPEKYCDLLKSEGGIQLLDDILKSNTTTQSMKKYAGMALKKVEEVGKE